MASVVMHHTCHKCFSFMAFSSIGFAQAGNAPFKTLSGRSIVPVNGTFRLLFPLKGGFAPISSFGMFYFAAITMLVLPYSFLLILRQKDRTRTKKIFTQSLTVKLLPCDFSTNFCTSLSSP